MGVMLSVKLDIVKRVDHGEGNKDIGCVLNFGSGNAQKCFCIR